MYLASLRVQRTYLDICTTYNVHGLSTVLELHVDSCTSDLALVRAKSSVQALTYNHPLPYRYEVLSKVVGDPVANVRIEARPGRPSRNSPDNVGFHAANHDRQVSCHSHWDDRHSEGTSNDKSAAYLHHMRMCTLSYGKYNGTETTLAKWKPRNRTSIYFQPNETVAKMSLVHTYMVITTYSIWRRRAVGLILFLHGTLHIGHLVASNAPLFQGTGHALHDTSASWLYADFQVQVLKLEHTTYVRFNGPSSNTLFSFDRLYIEYDVLACYDLINAVRTGDMVCGQASWKNCLPAGWRSMAYGIARGDNTLSGPNWMAFPYIKVCVWLHRPSSAASHMIFGHRPSTEPLSSHELRFQIYRMNIYTFPRESFSLTTYEVQRTFNNVQQENKSKEAAEGCFRLLGASCRGSRFCFTPPSCVLADALDCTRAAVIRVVLEPATSRYEYSELLTLKSTDNFLCTAALFYGYSKDPSSTFPVLFRLQYGLNPDMKFADWDTVMVQVGHKYVPWHHHSLSLGKKSSQDRMGHSQRTIEMDFDYRWLPSPNAAAAQCKKYPCRAWRLAHEAAASALLLGLGTWCTWDPWWADNSDYMQPLPPSAQIRGYTHTQSMRNEDKMGEEKTTPRVPILRWALEADSPASPLAIMTDAQGGFR
ncbi:hypothetical protein ACRALDRAFT_2045332 [Sodiomyces alcalophilus JCM 7366]|uniref:uncharacterized protein n=1 Tax=Sodiomyces alcalophilus JCM 7366 TaxID=591952 RepID=UPI0039B6C178